MADTTTTVTKQINLQTVIGIALLAATLFVGAYAVAKGLKAGKA